jgi:iron-sulfur cluster assembly protein/iron-sulfur cluster insertion protein
LEVGAKIAVSGEAGLAGSAGAPRPADFGFSAGLRPFDSPGVAPMDKIMITLTPRAAKQVRTMHEGLDAPEKRLRVLVESGGCSGFQYGMSFDERKPDDTEIQSEGVAMIIDPTSLAYLQGTSIDFDDGLHGKGFELKNPNAQSTCGCGKSFS